MSSNRDQQQILDRVGVWISLICAFHCAATPVIILFVPVLEVYFQNPWVHALIGFFIVPIGLWAFWLGYHHHRKPYIPLLGSLGLVLLLWSFQHPFPIFLHGRDIGHELLTLAASTFLITAHIQNRKHCVCHVHTNKS